MWCFGSFSAKVAKMDLSCEENMQNSGDDKTRINGQIDSWTAGPDRALDTDSRILLNLLTLERIHSLHTDYLQNVQNDIQPYMRKIVTTWMLEVCDEQRCEEQVFPLAVTYMDRFLSVNVISRNQLQSLGVTAMLVASKFRQCHPLSIDLLCAYTDNSVIPSEVRSWEVLLLHHLGWRMSIPTAFDFIEPLLARTSWGRSNALIRTHALTLISICYTEIDFLLVPPSLVALSCIISAARGLHVPINLAEFCELTRASPYVAECVVQHVERVLTRETQNITKTTPVTPIKQPLSPLTKLPTTPTDVQDIHY